MEERGEEISESVQELGNLRIEEKKKKKEPTNQEKKIS